MAVRGTRLDVVVFTSGGVVMILELVGGRVIAPHLGLSLYVWTSVIGVILTSLGLGYALGGRLADRRPNQETLGRVLGGAGFALVLMALSKDVVLAALSGLGALAGSLIASAVLFLPSSTLLAMVTPYAVKLRLKTIETTGTTAGNLYASATAGSIAGTFLAGYVLIPNLYTSTIILWLAAATFGCGLLVRAGWRGSGPAVAVLCLAGGWLYLFERSTPAIDVRPSAYSLIKVVETDLDGRSARLLVKDAEVNAGIFLDAPELAFPIYRYFASFDEYFVPHPTSALLIGGGAYVTANDFLRRFPAATIDVVEIDPQITAVARMYFGLEASPRLAVFHDDGRSFLNAGRQRYDIIYSDAFGSFYATPFQLATREAIQRMYDHLDDRGVVLVNVVSGLAGPSAAFLEAEYKTFASVFPHVYAFAVQSPQDRTNAQNVLLAAVKDREFVLPAPADPPAGPDGPAGGEGIAAYLRHRIQPAVTAETPFLEDEFAPLDYYVAQLTIPGH